MFAYILTCLFAEEILYLDLDFVVHRNRSNQGLIKSEQKKTRHVQKLAIIKNPQFLSDPNETW